MNEYAKRGFSPHARLLMAQAEIDGINVALLLQKELSAAIFELRSGVPGDFDNSVLLGTGKVSFKAEGKDIIRSRKKCDVEVRFVGTATWFCLRSKKHHEIYYIGTCGDHRSTADLLMDHCLVHPLESSYMDTMQISAF